MKQLWDNHLITIANSILQSFMNFITHKNLFIYLGIFTVLPLLILSFFNNPASDDFEYGIESQIEPFFSLQIRRYLVWSGRYFSNGLLSILDPLVYDNYFWFKIIPIIVIALFIFALLFLLNNLNAFISKQEKFAIIGLLMFLYIIQMPNVAESFFWLPACYTYQIPQIFILFFVSFLIKYYQTKKYFYFIISCVCLAVFMGCNEITTISFTWIFTFLLVYSSIVFKKVSKILVILSILVFIFAAIEILAPGNYVKSQHIVGRHNFVVSGVKSVAISTELISKWFPIITIVFLFCIDSICTFLNNDCLNKKYIINPIVSFGFLFVLVSIGFFPGYWSINYPIPTRSQNAIYFLFIFLYLYFLVTLTNYLKIDNFIDFKRQKQFKVILGIVILFLAFSSENINNSYKDLLLGRAYIYDIEMQNRFQFIKKCEKAHCVLFPLNPNTPLTIYSREVMGLTNDKNNWKNLEIARYFGKKSIIIKPKDSLLTE